MPADVVSYENFEQFLIQAGTVIEAEPFPEARNPSIRLRIDLGPHGYKWSSAQITDNYLPEELLGRQVIVVANFPPKRIAGFESECLVLGVMTESTGVVLLRPDLPVENGSRVL